MLRVRQTLVRAGWWRWAYVAESRQSCVRGVALSRVVVKATCIAGVAVVGKMASIPRAAAVV